MTGSNADGKPDLAVPAYYFNDVWVLLNTCVSESPALVAVRLNSTLAISWPFPSAGFVLESTTSLSLTNWQSAAEPATTNNNRLEVSVPLDQSQRFFRLRKP